MLFWRSLYIAPRFFVIGSALVFILILAYLIPAIFLLAQGALLIFIALIIVDFAWLFLVKKGVEAERKCADKFSNGDDNPVEIWLQNNYANRINIQLIDELPEQLQIRDQSFESQFSIKETKLFTYNIKPQKRGVYEFGMLNAFVSSPLQIITRRYQLAAPKTVSVYPSFVQMRKYELLALSNQLQAFGVKKIRRIGNNMEFEQIKNYVIGDDYRKVNWKATARKGDLMVNQYQDERSQQVYAVIDKGRLMQMPFEGLSLLDYAINSSLVITNIALKKGDKAGVVTFQHKVNSILPASSRNMQLNLILEHLYKQKTSYKESDFSQLYGAIKRKITQRSLLLLFTNFESLSSLKRQLPYLRRLKRNHLLVCVFFENTEIQDLAEQKATDVEAIYTKGLAEQLIFEKRLISKELQKNGIHTILAAPEQLSVNTINKYLELKARGLI